MGHSKVISCLSCCSASEQHGRINHGRVLCLQSYSKDKIIHEKRRLWSDDEKSVIQRQMDFLSLHSKGYPQVDKAVSSESCDQASGIELLGEPGLPDGWEQCLDLETGECFYLDNSCGKRTKRDPRPILAEANNNIRARCFSHSPLVDQDAATPSNCFHQDSKSDSHSATVSSSMDILSTEHDGKVPILKACSKCLIYFLIPREVKECPWCNTHLFGV